ncbi:MAG: hypothetical protein J7M25_06790 [Deltaproteobacteria bacterium]|nr:hypothetical protein [Deltaproteobacteria bacterium]
MRRSTRTLCQVGIACALVMTGCGKKNGTAKNTQAAPRTVNENAPGMTAQASAMAPAMAPDSNTADDGTVDGMAGNALDLGLGKTITKKTYSLTLTGPTSVLPGKKVEYLLTLTPMAGYHANKLFPFSLKMTKIAAGLVGKQAYKKADAALFQPDKVVFKIGFTAAGTAKGKTEGLYKFSVCTPKFCETPTAHIHWALGAADRGARPARVAGTKKAVKVAPRK